MLFLFVKTFVIIIQLIFEFVFDVEFSHHKKENHSTNHSDRSKNIIVYLRHQYFLIHLYCCFKVKQNNYPRRCGRIATNVSENLLLLNKIECLTFYLLQFNDSGVVANLKIE